MAEKKITEADQTTLESLRSVFQSPESEALVSISNAHLNCINRCCSKVEPVESFDETEQAKIVKAGEVAKALAAHFEPAKAAVPVTQHHHHKK